MTIRGAGTGNSLMTIIMTLRMNRMTKITMIIGMNGRMTIGGMMMKMKKENKMEEKTHGGKSGMKKLNKTRITKIGGMMINGIQMTIKTKIKSKESKGRMMARIRKAGMSKAKIMRMNKIRVKMTITMMNKKIRIRMNKKTTTTISK